MNGLKKARLLRGKTQQDIRMLTGIQASRLSLLERGYYSPRLDELKRISDALRVDTAELLKIGD